MAFEIKVPRLGWTMEEGTFVGWLKADGEVVKRRDLLFVLESDKATEEIEAVDSGVLHIAPDAPASGEKVAVGGIIGYLLEPDEEPPPLAGRSSRSGEASAPRPEGARADAGPRSESRTRLPGGRHAPPVSPRAARLARELGVDLSRVAASGRSGRIRARDVLALVDSGEEGGGRMPQPESRPAVRRNLEGKVSLVTGAARGIGKAIADRLASSGAIVYYSDIDLAGARQAAAGSDRCRALELDVSDEKQVDWAIGQLKNEAGKLDILVNNAGVNTLDHRVPIDRFPREEWDRILSVDLTGLYLVSRAGARIMRAQRSGRIINIASIAGLVPLRLQCPFVAAKAGVVNLTKAMALELGPHGILVNGIAPGSTLTEGTRKLFYSADGKFHDSMQRMLDHVPLGRPATTDEIAVAALFLCDPENSYMNGHVLTVDGGWTAGYTRDF